MYAYLNGNADIQLIAGTPAVQFDCWLVWRVALFLRLDASGRRCGLASCDCVIALMASLFEAVVYAPLAAAGLCPSVC